MYDILHQLGELFLQAVPTVVVVFLFYLFLRWSFFGPIQRVLKERQARVEGAHRESESLRAQAEEKRKERQAVLRRARAEIFSQQESVRSVANAERDAAVQHARSRATEQILAAKARIAEEIKTGRAELDAASQSLAQEIAQAILERRPEPEIAGERR